MKFSPIFVGFTILAAIGHAQTITPGSTGHGQPAFNCAVNDTYKDMDTDLVWRCKTLPNGWVTTPYFQPFGGSGGFLPLTGGTLTGPLGIAVPDGSAGYFSLAQGTVPSSTPANSVTLLAPTSVTAYNVTLPGTAPSSNGQTLSCTTAGVCTWAAGGAVTSVSNSDTTLTVSPTTGAVVASVNQGHAFTWTGLHDFAGDAGSFTIFPAVGNAFFQMSGTGGDTWQPFANSAASGHNHRFGFYNVTQTVEPFAISGGSGTTWLGLPTVGGLGWTTQAQFPDNDSTLETAFWRVSSGLVSLGTGTSGDATGTLKVAAILPGVIYSAAGTALPSCVTGLKGRTSVVSDATAPTYLGTYTSGGAIVAPVMCNGTNWVTY
jgi:hypothetical protein